jgi:hypothetical protein
LLGRVFADKFFRPFSQHLASLSILGNWTDPDRESRSR